MGKTWTRIASLLLSCAMLLTLLPVTALAAETGEETAYTLTLTPASDVSIEAGGKGSVVITTEVYKGETSLQSKYGRPLYTNTTKDYTVTYRVAESGTEFQPFEEEFTTWQDGALYFDLSKGELTAGTYEVMVSGTLSATYSGEAFTTAYAETFFTLNVLPEVSALNIEVNGGEDLTIDYSKVAGGAVYIPVMIWNQDMEDVTSLCKVNVTLGTNPEVTGSSLQPYNGGYAYRFYPYSMGLMEDTDISFVAAYGDIRSETSASITLKFTNQQTAAAAAVSDGQDTRYFPSLEKAIAAAGSGNTVTLLADAVLSDRTNIDKDMTLDLGGHKITSNVDYSFVVYAGCSFTVKNGTLENEKGTAIFGLTGAEITIEKDAVLEVFDGICATNNSADQGKARVNLYGTIHSARIAVWGQGPNNVFHIDGADITANYFAIYQNGSFGGSTYTIKNSTIVNGSDGGPAIYISNSKTTGAMQTLTVENSAITGETGIEVKYTDVTIKGEGTKIVATGTPVDTTPNNNGNNTNGYAFAATHNGTDTSADGAAGTLTIENGTFMGLIGIQQPVNGAETAAALTISGGTFSTDPTEYVAEGCQVSESGGRYTVSKESSGVISGSSSSSGNKTETTTNPDGSTTTTVTKPDGTVTETTTDTNGNKTQTVTNPDGSATTTVEQQNGASSTTTVTQDGQTETQVKVPEAVVDSAQESGAAVALPMPGVSASADKSSAPVVKVELPADTTAKVEIPVENVTPGTVAVIVREDGTEEIIKATVTTENGVAVTLSDGDTVKIVDNSKTFEDVADSHWSAGAVDFATSRELFQGTSATTFSPDQDMTRAMIVTVLARYEGVDTDGSVWYEAGQRWAMESGISDGSNMDDSVSREQLAVMLWRYAGSPAASGSLDFADGDSVSAWAAEAMAWAVENGLINGMGDGGLNPQGQATRAQVAAILARFVQHTNG